MLDENLSFINDVSLRKKIQEALETMSFLYLKAGEFSGGVSQEMHRMIMLYSASVIEAILLYLYKKNKFSITKPDYSEVCPLPNTYQLSDQFKLVFAKQIKKEIPERELMLDKLLSFFVEQGVIDNDLKIRIDRTRNIRNTFHLSKSRKGVKCNVQSSNASSKAVLDTITTVRLFLSKR